MSRKIALTKGFFAWVDDNDFEYLNQWTWHYSHGYAVRRIRDGKSKKTIIMHRLILNAPGDFQVDHINGNKLDNRKENLRVCSASQNKSNVDAPSTNTSGYKGVSFHKIAGRWRATIKINQKSKHLGHFNDPKDAARAYDLAAIALFGDYARLNFNESREHPYGN